MTMKCVGCGKHPDQIYEYVFLAESEGHPSAAHAVIAEEGTYSAETNRFACTDCYVRMGQPATTEGWKA